MKLKVWDICLWQVRWSKPKRMVLETTHTNFRFTEQLKMNKNTIFTILSELVQHAIYIFIQSLLLDRTPYKKRIRRSNQLRLMRHPKYGTAFWVTLLFLNPLVSVHNSVFQTELFNIYVKVLAIFFYLQRYRFKPDFEYLLFHIRDWKHLIEKISTQTSHGITSAHLKGLVWQCNAFQPRIVVLSFSMLNLFEWMFSSCRWYLQNGPPSDKWCAVI